MRTKMLDGQLQLFVYGPIGNMGFFDEGGVTALDFVDALSQNQHERVLVRINSPGGSASDGAAIFNLLSSHDKPVNTLIDGDALSAASIIAMAGDSIEMASNSMLMIHEASSLAIGTADTHREVAEVLEKVNEAALTVYAAKTGLDPVTLAADMKAETWMTAKEAKERGFATKITDAKAVKPAMSIKQFGYRHVPQMYGARFEMANAPGAQRKKEIKMDRTFAVRLAAAMGLNDSVSDDRIVETAAKVWAQMQSIEAAFGKSGDALVEAAREGASASSKLVKVQAELHEQRTRLQDEKRARLVSEDKQDPKGRKLTPALIELYANKPVEDLEAFLAVAPYAVDMSSHREPSGLGRTGNPPQLSQDEWAQKSAVEKAAIARENPELFNQMQNQQHGGSRHSRILRGHSVPIASRNAIAFQGEN